MTLEHLAGRAPYLIYVVLILVGLYLILTHRNYLKILVGLTLVQAGTILYFILLSVRDRGTIPILDEGVAALPVNPLPHALMLTAIVVGVSLLGVALAILRRVRAEHGTIDEHRAEEA